MPLAIREKIAADIREVVSDPEINAKLAATGQVVNPGSPKEFQAALDEQSGKVVEIGKILGIQAAVKSGLFIGCDFAENRSTFRRSCAGLCHNMTSVTRRAIGITTKAGGGRGDRPGDEVRLDPLQEEVRPQPQVQVGDHQGHHEHHHR